MSLIPLESNPDVMTKFIHQLGVPSKWALVDVYGLEPPLLAMVPKPTLALILLYPLSAKEQEYTTEIETKIKENGQEVSPNLFYMQQAVPNACGTVALIHATLNNLDQIELEDGILKTFWEDAKDLSFEARGKLLDTTTSKIIDAHEQVAQEGQTPAPQEDTPVYHHFVAFVEKDGCLYELDGRKTGPINHGATTKEKMFEDAVKISKGYMDIDPKEFRFTIMALAAHE